MTGVGTLAVEYRVLGPLRVLRDGDEVELGGPRQRRLLLRLLLGGREGVSDDRLVADLLDGDRVRRPEATLRTYVARLRRCLDVPAGGGGTVVERLPAGYRLRVSAEELDAAVFEQRTRRGADALDRGDAAAASRALTEALAVWGGTPYSEVSDEAWAQAEAQRLRHAHVAARERLADARLISGHLADAVGDLRELAVEEPFRESVVQRLMLAHHATGDPAAALGAYGEFRDRLAGELGLDPSPELVDLHRRILQRDPTLGVADVAGWSLRGYRVGPVLGAGRLGTVYAARMPGVDRDYAVRVYRVDVADHPQALRGFEGRARSLSVLDDPGLVRVIDGWREPGLAVLVMRRLTGGTLQDRLDADTVTREQAREVVERVGGALRTLHARGIRHGRVRPSSVLFDEQGRCYLADPELDPDMSSSDTADFVQLTETVMRAVGDEGVVGGDLTDLVSLSAQDIDAAVSAALREMQEPARVANPYVGLRAFEQADAEVFFGRERLVGQVLHAVRDPAGARLVVVVGGSGSGKSSVVRAGVVPRLGEGWLAASMVPGHRPFDNLTEALTQLATRGTDVPAVDGAEPGSLAAAAGAVLDEDRRLLLFVDQMEELFTASPAPAREEFLAMLASAVTAPDSAVTVAATLRGDFYDRPLEHASFGPLLGGATLAVPAMSADEITEVIEGPARHVGLELDVRLVDALRAAGAEPTALPALQFTLHALAQHGTPRLGLGDLADLGGVDGAIATRAEEVFGSLTVPQQSLFRRMAERLVVVEPSGGPSRRRTTRTELVALADSPVDADAVLETAINARLLVADHSPHTREPTVELAHEAVVGRWPRLRGWVDADRERLLALSRLEQDARAWDTAGRDEAGLARGARLEHAEELLTAAPAPPDVVRDYVQASTAQRDQEARAAAAAAREKARTAQRLRRQRVLLAGALVVALVLGGLAVVQAGVAQRSAAQAQSRAQAATAGLLAAADDAAESDWSLALLLAAEANRISDDPVTRRGLVDALVDRKPQATTVYDAAQAISTLDLDPSTGAVAVRTLADTVDVIDGQTGTVLAQDLAVPPATARGGLDVTGDLVAVGGGTETEGETVIYRLGSDDPVARLPWEGVVADVQLSPDGALLAAAGQGGEVKIYRTSDWSLQHTLAGASGQGLDTVTWSPNGARVYSGDLNGEMYAWNLDADQDPQPPDAVQLLPDHHSIGTGPSDITPVPGTDTVLVSQFEFASYLLDQEDLSIVAGPFRGAWASTVDALGRSLATAHNDTAVVRGLDEGTWTDAVPDSSAVLRRAINDMAFDADGTLVTAGEEGVVLRWDLDPPQPALEPLPGVATGQPVFSRGGDRMVMNSWFAPFQVFDTTTYTAVTDLDTGPADRANRMGVAFLDDDRAVAVSYCPNTSPDSWDKCAAVVAIFDTTSGERLAGPVDHGWVMGNTFSSVVSLAGDLVATGEVGGILTLRDAQTLQPVQTLDDLTGSPESDRAFLQSSPDGSVLVSRLEPAGRSAAWSVADGEATLLRTFPSAAVHPMPDNTVLLGTSEGWTIVDPASGETLTRVDIPTRVFSLSFTLDGRWMGITDGDGAGWIWSLEDMAALAGPLSAGWWGAEIEPTGGHVLLAGPDVMERFPLDPQSWQEMACTAAGRNLTEEEWGRYFVDEPYRDTCPDLAAAG